MLNALEKKWEMKWMMRRRIRLTRGSFDGESS